jgi:threonine synthase
MGTFTGYACSGCGRTFAPDEVTYTCPHDGANLDVVLDLQAVGRTVSPRGISASAEASIWRYLPLLPVSDPGHLGSPLRAVGWTPLFRAPRLAEQLGLKHLWIKDDGRNPTASFKDRASAVVVARAQAIGAGTVVTASTGNAGAALAGMAAAVSQPAVILAPKTAPPAKVAQLLVFGAKVFLVEGSYDQAFNLTLEAAESFGWYCRNTGYNPFTLEGKKTAAFEICEQLAAGNPAAGGPAGGWESPDVILVSVGDGNIISGIHKGLRELSALDWIGSMPRLIGVQSEGSAAIFNAFQAGTEVITPVHANTLADSISVDLPRDGVRAVRAATRTGGSYLAVPDSAILQAIIDLGCNGIFAEPAGATAYAGLVKAVEQGLISPNERVVVLVTGSGLKDVRAAMQAAGEARVIAPTLPALRQAL